MNVIPKLCSKQLLEENKGENICDLMLGRAFLDNSPNRVIQKKR